MHVDGKNICLLKNIHKNQFSKDFASIRLTSKVPLSHSHRRYMKFGNSRWLSVENLIFCEEEDGLSKNSVIIKPCFVRTKVLKLSKKMLEDAKLQMQRNTRKRVAPRQAGGVTGKIPNIRRNNGQSRFKNATKLDTSKKRKI